MCGDTCAIPLSRPRVVGDTGRAMSQENVEVVQAIYQSVLAEGRDAPSYEQLEQLFAPDIELQQMDGVLGTTGTFRGFEGLFRAREELVSVFDDFYIVAEQHFEDGDNVVTVARGRGTGRGSGVAVDMRVGHLWTLRAGRVVRWVVYTDPSDALKAVGLRE